MVHSERDSDLGARAVVRRLEERSRRPTPLTIVRSSTTSCASSVMAVPVPTSTSSNDVDSARSGRVEVHRRARNRCRRDTVTNSSAAEPAEAGRVHPSELAGSGRGAPGEGQRGERRGGEDSGDSTHALQSIRSGPARFPAVSAAGPSPGRGCREAGAVGGALRLAHALAEVLVGDVAIADGARGPQLDVLVAVARLGGAALQLGQHRAGREAAGREEEAGVRDHAVIRAHGEALDVPAAHHRLARVGLGEQARAADVLGDAGELGRRGDVAEHHAAGGERVGDGVDALPRGEHVEHDAVDRAGGHDVAAAARRGRRRRPPTTAASRRGTSRRSRARRPRTPRAARTRRGGPPGRSARSSQSASAPEPTPASTTVAPGKTSACARICAASFG